MTVQPTPPDASDDASEQPDLIIVTTEQAAPVDAETATASIDDDTTPREPGVSPWFIEAGCPFEVAVHGLERGWMWPVVLKDRQVQDYTVVAEEPQLRLHFAEGVSEGVLWFHFELRGSPLVTCFLPMRVNPEAAPTSLSLPPPSLDCT